MANPEWGAKRVCPNCATKFYDFSRDPIVCPGCDSNFNPEDFNRPKRGARAEPRAESAAALAAVRQRAKPRDDEDAVEADEAIDLEADEDIDLDDDKDVADDDGDDDTTLVLAAAGESEDDEDDDVLEADEDDEDLDAELSSEIDPDYRKEDVG